MLEFLTQSACVERIGWVLVHSLWQFALLALLAIALQRALLRHAAATRYQALLTVLAIAVAVPIATWFSLPAGDAPAVAVMFDSIETADNAVSPQPSDDTMPTTAQPAMLPVEVAAEVAKTEPFEPAASEPAPIGKTFSWLTVKKHVEPWLAGIVLFWFGGVCVVGFRPLLSWLMMRRLRTRGISRADSHVNELLERVAERLQLTRAVDVLQSTLVKTPVVIGYFRPVVLLPLCVATGLPPLQLELILAHELAHIRRHDYLVNLLQTLVETLFFYHPAVWWLSRQIRNERENCCDDVAMATVGSRADYGRTLLAIAELRAASPALSLAARGGSLVARIRRIAGCEPAPRVVGGGSVLGVILVSLAVFAAVTWGASPAAEKLDPKAAATAMDVAAKMKEKLPSREADEEVDVRYAIAVANVAKAEYEVAVEANKIVGNSVPDAEVQRLLLKWQEATRAVDEAKKKQLASGVKAWKPGQVLDFRVINAKTKEPLAGVKLRIGFSAGGSHPFYEGRNQTTEAQGRCEIKLPDRQPEWVQIYPSKPGFVPLLLHWRSTPTPPDIPKSITVPLEPGAMYGGIVQNEQGKPIPGVTVTIHYQEHGDGPVGNSHRGAYINNEQATTDKDGRWQFGNLPATIVADELRIYLTHPDYIGDRLRPSVVSSPITKRPAIEALRAKTAVMVMRKGAVVAGRVTDEAGKPISHAAIFDQDECYYGGADKPAATTDSDGRFQISIAKDDPADEGDRRLRGDEVKKTFLTVQARGYAPELIAADATDEAMPLDISLKRGQTVQGRVVDETGKPLAGVSVSADYWRGHPRRLNRQTKTDADGRFRLNDAPIDAVKYSLRKDGYSSVESFEMSPSPQGEPAKADYLVTLKPPVHVVGTIVDAETGKPLAKCTAMLGWDDSGGGRATQWQRLTSAKTIADGRFEFVFTQEWVSYRIRVEAEGYMPAVSRVFKPYNPDKGRVTYDFKLTKAPPLSGTVLGPDGKPLADVEVVLATNLLNVENRKVASNCLYNNRMVRTGAAGRFEFPPEVEPFYLVAVHAQGHATVDEKQFAAASTIRLEPWSDGEDGFSVQRMPMQPAPAAAAPFSRPARAVEDPEQRRQLKAAILRGEKFSSKDGSLQWVVVERIGTALTDGFTIGRNVGQLPGYRMLMLPSILKKLAITDQQKARLDKMLETRQLQQAQSLREISLRGAPLTVAQSKSYEKWRKEASQETRTQVEAILTPEQRQAYKDIELYSNAWISLIGSHNDARLQLSDEQTKQLRAIREEYLSERQQRARKQHDAILSVLTPKQRAQLREAALGSLGMDYLCVLTLYVPSQKDTVCLYALDPYPDFSDEKTDVQKQLGLTAAQQKQVRDILGDSSTVTETLLRQQLKLPPDQRAGRQSTYLRYHGRTGGWGGLFDADIQKKQLEFEEIEKEDRRARWAERQSQPLMQMTVALRRQFEAILTPEQLTAYQDMAVRNVLAFVWSDFILRRYIGVTKEQEAEVQRMAPDGSSRIFWDSECDLGKRMLAVLTPAQREKLPRRVD